ncbi:MAG: prolyl oligopeptidase family serine peptidase [Pyrinomonadaceae bacterium]
MLYLHGADDRGDDNQLQLRGLAEHIKTHPQDFQFVIVFPQCPVNRFWDKQIIWQAEDALQRAITEFDGDESRLYLAGFSLGGFGVWTRAVTHPMEFAAIVPMSGRVLPRPNERGQLGDYVLELADAPDPYAAYANRIGNVPIWIFHGAGDKVVPLEGSRQMVQAIKDAGNENVVYSELQGIGHYTVDAAFGNPELFSWLAKQKRQNISYEKVDVVDDIVYAAVLESIFYDETVPFGSLQMSDLLILNGETISSDDSTIPSLEAKVPKDVVEDFADKNKRGNPLREGDYGVHFPLRWAKGGRSLADLFEDSKKLEHKMTVKGVVGLSAVGYDANRSRSLVYVEFVNTEKELIRKYCLYSWKRDGKGLMRAGVKWIAIEK